MLLFRVVFLALKIIYSGHFVPTTFLFQSCLSGTLRKVVFRVSTLGGFRVVFLAFKIIYSGHFVPTNFIFQSCFSGTLRKVVFRVSTLAL